MQSAKVRGIGRSCTDGSGGSVLITAVMISLSSHAPASSGRTPSCGVSLQDGIMEKEPGEMLVDSSSSDKDGLGLLHSKRVWTLVLGDQERDESDREAVSSGAVRACVSVWFMETPRACTARLGSDHLSHICGACLIS